MESICLASSFQWRWNATADTVAGITNSPANTSYQLFYPTGMIMDSSNRFYIADNYNHRIQKMAVILIELHNCGRVEWNSELCFKWSELSW